MVIMGLSRTVSEIYGDFSRKSQKNFPPPFYFVSPLKGFPLEFDRPTGVGGGQKITMMGLPGRQRSLTIVFSRLERMHERDRQTDGQTDTGPQQRPRLRTPSRGKNEQNS